MEKVKRDAYRFDLIAFDWDGTLYNSLGSVKWAVEEAAKEMKVVLHFDQNAIRKGGMDILKVLSQIAPGLNAEQLGELRRRFYLKYSEAGVHNHLFDGIFELLQSLRDKGFLLAIATANGRLALDNVLAQTGLAGFFDATQTADDARAKPHPQMLQNLMNHFGLDKGRMLMVGDMTFDLQMAKNAGCAGVGVLYAGFQSRADLLPFDPIYLANTVEDLSRWLLPS